MGRSYYKITNPESAFFHFNRTPLDSCFYTSLKGGYFIGTFKVFLFTFRVDSHAEAWDPDNGEERWSVGTSKTMGEIPSE